MLKKEDSRFLKISKKINKEINSGRFEEAVKDYADLSEAYSLLSESKSKNKITFLNIRSQLLIYLKIKETENMLKRNNSLDMIRDNINQLKSLYSEYSINRKLLSYARKKVEYLLNYYEYKIYKKELNHCLDNIYHYIWEERYEDALKKFPEIMSKFKQMERHVKNDKLYSSLMRLKTHIKTSLLADQAYSEISKISKI
tara:strand:+ start:945 stop:1541 length:597 start_codon:yes stop_codon:yes gene_type:complete